MDRRENRAPFAAAPLLFIFLLLCFSPASRGPASGAVEAPLHLRVETLRVGPGGTETLSADEAALLPGKRALLAKEVTLSSASPEKKRSEKISLRVEILLDSLSPSGAMVTVQSRVNVLATTGGIPIPASEIRRELAAPLAEGASQLFEVYTSPALETKVTLNIRWFGDLEEGSLGENPVPIPLTARVYEVERGAVTLLSENRILAAVGGTASATFNRSVSLPEGKGGRKRIRQDRLEIALSPRFLVGRSLSLALEATGDLATLTSEGTVSHPVARQEELLLSPGIPSSIELELAADDPEREGWDRIHLRLEVTGVF